jgi:sterol desaturase/sphingolipid hydroxylase (fatty acid hydroxylase superfamily)
MTTKNERPTNPPRTPAQQAVRLAYPVVMLIGLNGLAIHVAESGLPKLWLAGVLCAGIALSFAAERMLPYEPSWNAPRGDVARDWLHFAVNEAANLASVAALPLVAGLRPFGDRWPHGWPFAWQVLASVVVFDFGITAMHWASHRVPALWRLHAVHHSVKRFYGFNGLMKHPLHQVVEMTVGILPLLLLGLPHAVAAALATLVGIQLLMQHSNVDYWVGPLRYVLALNEGHRFHHLKWGGVGDVNFGLFTNLWDQVLCTWCFDPERRFTSDDLGIGREPNFPAGYLPQVLAPFRRRSP